MNGKHALYDRIDLLFQAAVNATILHVGNKALRAGLSTDEAMSKCREACMDIEAWRDHQYSQIERMPSTMLH